MSNLNKLMNLITKEPCILICDNDTKMMILSKLDFISDITFKTVSEAERDLLGYYDDIVVYLIKHKLNVKYDRAKLIYDSLIIGEIISDDTLNLKDELKDYYHNKINYNKRIILASKPSRLLEYALKNYDYSIFEYENNNNIYGFKYNDIISEVEALAYHLSKIYKENNCNNFDDFVIYIGDSEYLGVIEDVFSFYGIPLSYELSTSLYQIPKIKELVDNSELDSIDLSNIHDNELKNAFIKCYNKLVLIDFNKDDLIDELDNCAIRKTTKGVAIKNASSINPMYKYTFILGFTFKNIPSIHKDDLYYSDIILDKYSINTSFKENKKEKEYFIKSLMAMNLVYISYSLNGITGKYTESDLLDNIVKFNENNDYKFKYSIKRAKLDYNKAIEQRMLTGEENEYLESYRKVFGKKEQYDSSFNDIDSNLVKNKVFKDGIMNVSYSKLEKYYSCPFSYYCDYILKIGVFKNSADVGNVLHLFLEKYFNNKDYTLDMAIEEYNKTNPEPFVLREPYKSKFQNVIDKLLEEIDEECNDYNLKLVGTELEKELILDSDPSIHLVGKIDKVMDKDGKRVIFDYKSGSKISLQQDPSLDMDNKTSDYYKKYQLFIYLLFEHVKYEDFEGVFYQRIMPKNKDDLKEIEDNKFFKPYGYKDLSSTLPFSSGGIKKDAGAINKEQYDKVIEDTNDLIIKFKNNILNARFDIKPLDGSCKFCNYKNVCYYSFKEDGDSDE